MSTLSALLKFRQRRPIILAVIGNSVGQGSLDLPLDSLNAMYQSNYKFLPQFMESDAPAGVYSYLRAHMVSVNPASRVVNYSGSGWDTNDHRGIQLPSSSIVGSNDTVAEILNKDYLPDLVFMPLQINDPNHGLTVATFKVNMQNMIQRLLAAGVPVVLVKENYTTISGYANFITAVDELAAQYNLEVIDTFTPFGSGTGLMADYAHPNHAGHYLIFKTILSWFYSDLSQVVDVAFANSEARVPYEKGGPVRIKTSDSFVSLGISEEESAVKLKTSAGVLNLAR